MENISSKSFYRLNDENVSIYHRVKLAKYLWVNNNKLPNKEVSLINWIVSVITSLSDTNNVLLWKTLANFLLSFQLHQFQSQSIVLKSSFLKIYLKMVNSADDKSIPFLFEIGKCLINNERITNDASTKFEIFLTFFSTWVILLRKNFDEDVIKKEEMKNFVLELFERLTKVLANHNNSIKAFSQFVDGGLDVIFQLLEDVDSETDPIMYKLSHLALKEGLFLRKREIFIEQNNKKKNENVQLLLNKLNKMNEKVKVTIYTLFMECYKNADATAKFDFFSKLIFEYEIKSYLEDYEMGVLACLLKNNMDERLYQPSVDQNFAKIQQDKYDKLLTKMLHKNTVCNENWSRCVTIIANICSLSVESKLDDISHKVFNLSAIKNDFHWLQTFFNNLSQVFNQIRKPLKLLELMLQTIAKKFEKTHYGIYTLFANAISRQCSNAGSCSLSLEIFSIIQQEVLNELQKSARPKNIDILITILSIFIENSSILEFSLQHSAMSKFMDLLHHQLSIVQQLFDAFSGNLYDVIGSIIQLKTVHDYCFLVLQAYNCNDEEEDETDIAILKDWQKLSSILQASEEILLKKQKLGKRTYLTYNDLFLWRKWECFEMEKIFIASQYDMVTPDQASRYQDLANNFVKKVCSNVNNLNCSIMEFFEVITNKEMLTNASLFLLQSNFDIVVSGCNDQSISNLVEFLVKGYLENQDQVNGDKINIFHKILFSTNFYENKRLSVLSCDLLLSVSLQYSKVNLENDQYTEINQLNDEETSDGDRIFQNCLHIAFPDYIYEKLNFLLTMLPVKLSDKKPNIFLLATLIFKGSENLTGKIQAIKILWKITDNMQDNKFFSSLDIGFLFSTFLDDFNNYSPELQGSISNFLGSVVKTCCMDMKFKGFVKNICSNLGEGINKNDVFSAKLILETLSLHLLAHHDSISSGIKKSLVLLKGESVELKINKSLAKKADDEKSTNNKVEKRIVLMIKSLNKGILSSSEILEDGTALRSLLLSHIILDDISQSTEFENYRTLNKNIQLDSRITEIISSLSSVKDTNSIELVLVYSEIQLILFNHSKKEEVNYLSVKSLVECYLSGDPSYCSVLDRILLIQMFFCNEKLPDVFGWSISCLQETDIEEKDLFSQLKFVQLCANLFKVNSRKFENLPDDDDKDLNFCQTKFLRNALDICAEIMTRLVNGTPCEEDNSATLNAALVTMAAILNKGPAITRTRQLYIVFSALILINFDQPSKGNVQSVYDVTVSILLHHKDAIKNLVPLISTILHKFLKFMLSVRRVDGNDKHEILSKNCDYVERLCQFIVANYGSYFNKTVSYIIAEYVHEISNNLVKPAVKNNLESAMYHLLTLCDIHSVHMLRATLPTGERDVFHQMHQNFDKYFKYKGVV